MHQLSRSAIRLRNSLWQKRCVFNFSTTSTDCLSFWPLSFCVHVQFESCYWICPLFPLFPFRVRNKPHHIAPEFAFVLSIVVPNCIDSQSNHSFTHTMQKQLISSFYLYLSLLCLCVSRPLTQHTIDCYFNTFFVFISRTHKTYFDSGKHI